MYFITEIHSINSQGDLNQWFVVDVIKWKMFNKVAIDRQH